MAITQAEPAQTIPLLRTRSLEEIGPGGHHPALGDRRPVHARPRSGAKAFVEPVFGERHDRPVLRLREFLTALRAVVETGSADVAGETLVARTPMSAAVPGGAPLPVDVAAMGPQALRVTGELADGTLPFLAGPRALAEHIVPAITRAAEQAGRPAITMYHRDIEKYPRAWAQERYRQVVRWWSPETGGHFPSLEVPKYFVKDLQEGLAAVLVRS